MIATVISNTPFIIMPINAMFATNIALISAGVKKAKKDPKEAEK